MNLSEYRHEKLQLLMRIQQAIYEIQELQVIRSDLIRELARLELKKPRRATGATDEG